MEVGLQIGIILGHEHLVIDVAEVIQGLVATEAVWLGLIVGLLTHSTSPLTWRFLLVSDPAMTLIIRGLSLLFVVSSDHCPYFFIQILNIMPSI
jgi:ABC-type tungstate transport system substrate-binding protein